MLKYYRIILLMYLEKLEIQGFKSFANPAELAFNRKLTAIVGPNGSGKSNIADAVRWVLGEQSVKTLRGKKAEDVIFSGSDKKGRLGFAQVDLYLNNEDKQADVDFEQIVVTRKIDRNGESEYLVNNNKVRLFDVQLLLAKANFGQKTYSVIGQGMVDTILTSSSAERKEFFDEATGVRQFQIKKNQSVNKLANAKSNLEQTYQILAELAPRLRSLTRQVSRLERREKIQAELFDLQTDYYSFLSNNLNTNLTAARKQHDKLQSEVSDLNQSLIELQTKLEKEEKASSRQENFELLQEKLRQKQNEFNNLLKEKTILEGQADLKLAASGRSDLVWLKKQISNTKESISEKELLFKEKQNLLKNYQGELDVLEKKREAVLADFSSLEQKLLGNGGDISIDDLSLELDGILQKQKEFSLSLENISSLDSIPALRDFCRQITEEIGNLRRKIQQPEKKNQNNWQAEFNKLLSTKDTLVSEVSEARTKVAVLKNELGSIETDIKKEQVELSKLESEQKANEGRLDKNDYKEKLEDLNTVIEVKAREIKVIEEDVKVFNQAEESKKQVLVEAQKRFREVQAAFNSKNSELGELKINLARLETRQEELQKEIAEEFAKLKIKEVRELNPQQTKEKIINLKNQLSIIGGIDEAVLEEYKEVKERHDFLFEQTSDLEQAISQLEKIIKDLEETISDQFDKSFSNINKLFDKYFKKLFNGGRAELILDVKEIKEDAASSDEEEGDEENEEEAVVEKDQKIKKQYGIEIKAVPPGKRVSSINMLSGGEKALTSIALVCAIIANNPSPFVVLDEVDAALDEANSIRFVEILEELSDKTQFITITHNRASMHQSRIIYGVTMGDDGVSKLLSMNFAEADEIAA
ncbi:hypothetical protein C4566_02865 [Candidatus Parcubacteria bacterium]|nr:MAG: hypothetical protein C4566_02865 [Candidatus Parcubacteria bacterium]